MIKKIKKFWWLILLLIIIVFLFLKTNQTQNNKKNPYQVKIKNLKEELTLSGKIEAEEKVTLRFQSSGQLAWVGVKEGDYVKKYQTIASLDQRDLNNRLQKYLNTYAKERNNFEQGRDDYLDVRDFGISQAVSDQAKRILENNQYNLNNAVLDVEYQHLLMTYANLWTPIEGIVTKVSVPYAGVNITPAQAEFEVVNPKTLYFSVTADQTEVVNLKKDQEGEIIFDAYPEEPVVGKIYWIGFTPKANETGTVYEVKIAFNFDKPLKLEMSGDINFIIKEEKNVLSIPEAYLKKDKKGHYVNLFNNKKIIRQYVDIGQQINGEVIITNGLKKDDLIYD